MTASFNFHSIRLSLLACAAFLPLVACGTGTTGSLDGDWDVTSVGGDEVAPSSIAVSGGTIKGEIVSKREGQAVSESSPGCSYAQSRMTIDVSIEGDAMTGTFKEVRKYAGGDSCKTEFFTYTDKETTFSVIGKRTRKDAATKTDLNGVWELQASVARKPVVVTVKDLGAEFPYDDDKGSKGSISIANGKLSVVLPDGHNGSFNAQQR